MSVKAHRCPSSCSLLLNDLNSVSSNPGVPCHGMMSQNLIGHVKLSNKKQRNCRNNSYLVLVLRNMFLCRDPVLLDHSTLFPFISWRHVPHTCLWRSVGGFIYRGCVCAVGTKENSVLHVESQGVGESRVPPVP